MANPAREARQKAQARWPGASVSARGRNWIKHQHPSDPRKFMLDASIGPMHYGPSADQEIDTAWEADIGVWQHKMVKADFEARVKAAFNGAPLVEYRVGDDWVTLQPRQLDWHNDRNDLQVAGSIQAVTATVTDDVLRWDGAYGSGRHFEYKAQPSRLAKKIILDSYASMPAPTAQITGGGNPVLRAQFQFAWSSTLSVFVDGVEWTGGGGSPTLTTANAIEFRLDDGTVVFAFQNPHSTQTGGDEAPGMLLRVSRVGPNVLVETRTPQAWLEMANYPVVIDPTIDAQVGASANDGGWETSASSFSDEFMVIGDQGSSTSKNVFSNFTAAPEGTIDVAYVVYTHDGGGTLSTCAVRTSAVDAAAPSSPTNYTEAENATRTTAGVDWAAPNAGNGNPIQSASIVSVIQELVDNYTVSNILIYTEDNDSSNVRYRSLYDYSSSVANAASLHIEYTAGGGGTQYNQAAAGTLTTAGAIAKQAELPKAGVLSPVGSLVKETQTARAGTLTPAGTMSKQAQKVFAGVLTTAGALIGQARKAVGGSLSSSGAVSKSTDKSFAGNLTPSGALIKQAAKSFSGTLSTSGALNAVKTALMAVGGTLSMAGSLVKQGQKSLAGQVSPSGALVRQGQKVLAGALTSAGVLVKEARKSLTGALTTSGTLAATKTVLKAVGGALSFAGALVKQPQKALSGSVSPSGLITRQISISLSGTLSTAGTIVKRVSKAVSGVLSWAGALISQIVHVAANVPGRVTVSDTLLATVTVSDALAHTISVSDALVSDITIADTDNG